MSYLSLREQIERDVRWLAGRVLPGLRARRLDEQRLRDRVDRQLAGIAAESPHAFEGTVLIDGSWDNPYHWIRLTLLRAALGLHKANEIGFLGAFRIPEVRRTLEMLEVKEIVSFDSYPVDEARVTAETSRLLAATKRPEDILAWKLPRDFPPAFLYDAILKRQRKAWVDINDSRFPKLVHFALRCLDAAERLVSNGDVRLVVVSSVNSFRNAPLAWMAACRGIPTVAVAGWFSVIRFYKVTAPEQILGRYDRPTAGQIDALPSEHAEALRKVGRAYMANRRAGRVSDLAGVEAFKIRQETTDARAIRDLFGWGEEKPIIAVYAANWYDFPHAGGMKNFRDFADWLLTTENFAKEYADVYWLFKPHPNEKSYPGVTLREALPDLECTHVRFALDSWNNAAVMKAVDGIITVQGSIGIEAPSIGKPVLLADRGWYHDCGFVLWAKSRQDYFDKLGRAWWTEIDRAEACRRAEIFAGWTYGCPTWQGDFLLPDDWDKTGSYAMLSNFLSNNAEILRREIAYGRNWFFSDDLHYHTAKMRDATEFTLPNLQD